MHQAEARLLLAGFEGHFLHRTAAGRADREDSTSLRPLATFGVAGAARRGVWVHHPDEDADRQTAASDKPGELTYVDIDTFEATF